MQSILFLLSFLLLSFSSNAVSSSDPVLDLDGDSLQRGQPYYVLFKFLGSNLFGLTLHNDSCPLDLGFAWPENGRPVSFFPEEQTEDTVRLQNTFYAMFPEPTECPQSTVWKIGANHSETTGGTTSSAVGPHDSRFAIYKRSNHPADGYKFLYCPCSYGVSRPSCELPCDEDLELSRLVGDRKMLRVKGNNFRTGYFFEKANKGAKESSVPSAAMLFKS